MNEVVIWGVGGEEGNEGEEILTSFKLHMLFRHFCTKAGLFHCAYVCQYSYPFQRTKPVKERRATKGNSKLTPTQ
jgi:hypothetical protein